MAEGQLIELSKSFAVDIINITETVRKRGKATAIVNQLLRSGTGIGANIHEANYAQSQNDFISKLQIALKECYETSYWLEIFEKSGIIQSEEFESLNTKCNKLRKILASSITTAKESGK